MGRKKSKDNGLAKALLILGGLLGLFVVFAFYIDESLGAWWQIEIDIFGTHTLYYNLFGMTAQDDFTLRLELLGLFAGILFILGSVIAMVAAGKESKGLGLLSLVSIFGGLYHLVNHSIFKSLLFLNAGAIEYRIKTRNLKKMGGLARVMPTTSATNFIASMSISGIPPFNGFFSKLIIIIAAVQAQYFFIAILAVVVSIITLGSFLKIQKYAFYNKDQANYKNVPYRLLCLLWRRFGSDRREPYRALCHLYGSCRGVC